GVPGSETEAVRTGHGCHLIDRNAGRYRPVQGFWPSGWDSPSEEVRAWSANVTRAVACGSEPRPTTAGLVLSFRSTHRLATRPPMQRPGTSSPLRMILSRYRIKRVDRARFQLRSEERRVGR